MTPDVKLAPRWATVAAAAIVAALGLTARAQAPAGWTLSWSDEFDGPALDLAKWTPEVTNNPANNEQQAYRASQVTVANGNMVITSENIPTGGKPYVSGRVHSNYAQRHGRWEIRADLPTSKGMWPAIWLLPDTSQYNWPSQGEIDIMENRGQQPTLTSSAYHFGSNPPYFHDYRFSEQTTARFGQAVNYHTGFHTYAVEWDAQKLRFFVDDVHHWTLFSADISNYLANQTAPMRTMLNTAVGGDFLGPNGQPDATTAWPQQFLIDYVRIFEKNNDAIRFRNGGFEANDGSLAGWSTFGARVNVNNVSVHNQALADGVASAKIFGPSTGGTTYSGISQGITVAPGDEVRALAESFVRSQDALAGANSVVMKIEFYNDFGGRHGSSAFLNETSITIATASTAKDAWRNHELTAVAPAGAVEARLAFVYIQNNNAAGAVHLDNVSFVNPRLSPAGDADNDGDVDGDDLTVWQSEFGRHGFLAADFNRDGRVDAGDLLVWQQNHGVGLPSADPSAAPVPEPWGLAMALVAAARLIRPAPYVAP